MSLIQELAQKDYDERFLKVSQSLRNDLVKLQSLSQSRSASFLYQPLACVYSQLSEARKALVHPYVLPDEEYITEWLERSYQGLSFSPDDPVILSENGERVRSKSEKLLADKLRLLDVPYLYERPILLPGIGRVYVDFTLLDLQERTEVYYEHFGMMERPDYCRRAMSKIERFGRAGLLLGDRFLCTFESEGHMLDLQHFEKLIRARFH